MDTNIRGSSDSGDQSQIDNVNELTTDYLTLKKRYPNHIPILMQPRNVTMTKVLFMAPCHMNLSFKKFTEIVHPHIKGLEQHPLIFFESNNTVLHPEMLIDAIYKDHRHNNGFLYISVLADMQD